MAHDVTKAFDSLFCIICLHPNTHLLRPTRRSHTALSSIFLKVHSMGQSQGPCFPKRLLLYLNYRKSTFYVKAVCILVVENGDFSSSNRFLINSIYVREIACGFWIIKDIVSVQAAPCHLQSAGGLYSCLSTLWRWATLPCITDSRLEPFEGSFLCWMILQDKVMVPKQTHYSVDFSWFPLFWQHFFYRPLLQTHSTPFKTRWLTHGHGCILIPIS